jgi:hypothetical protein
VLVGEPQTRLLHTYWYERVMLNFAVDTPSLQRLLAPQWRVAERLGGSNLTIGLCEVIFDAEPDGAPRTVPAYLYVPVNGNVEHASNGTEANMRYLTLTDVKDAFPQCAVAVVTAEHSKETKRHGATVVTTEHYGFLSDAYEVGLDIRYTAGAAQRIAGGMDVRCPDDDSFEQRYENEEVQYPLRRGQMDLIIGISYRIRGGMLSALFDGTEKLASVTSVPASVRKVYAV